MLKVKFLRETLLYIIFISNSCYNHQSIQEFNDIARPTVEESINKDINNITKKHNLFLCSANVWSYKGSALSFLKPASILTQIYKSIKNNVNRIDTCVIGFQEDEDTKENNKNIMSHNFFDAVEKIFKGYNVIGVHVAKTGEGTLANSFIVLSKTLKPKSCKFKNFNERELNDNNSETPRSAILLDIQLQNSKNIRIINTHLFGGYIDDPQIVNGEIDYSIRNKMMEKVISIRPDVIMGDFNADKYENKNRIDSTYWRKIGLETILGKKSALKFLNSPHDLLEKKNFIPASPTVSSTTPFGITPDWIYINKNKKFEILQNGVIENGAKNGVKNISDHDFVYTILKI